MNTPDELLKLFGNNLRLLRRKSGLSQMAFSEKTKKSHTFINNIENGKKWISADTLDTFCRVLKVPPYEFFLTDDIRSENSAMKLKSSQKQLVESLLEMAAQYEKQLK